jgi:hypothetical protein
MNVVCYYVREKEDQKQMSVIIIATAVGTVVAVCLIALCKNVWTHRGSPNRVLGGFPGRIASKLKRKETEEEKEARRDADIVSSDDPDIWKPLN